MTGQEITSSLENMRDRLMKNAEGEYVPLSRYAAWAEEKALTDGNTVTVWTKALQMALDQNHYVLLDPSDAVYYIDSPVIVSSDTHIRAYGATVSLVPGCRTLLLRNASVVDGSSHPEDASVPPDTNITIAGGTWAECNTTRLGYSRSGCFDAQDSMPGVTTCILLSNAKDIALSDMVFRNTAAFSIQIGNAENICVEKIRFEKCFADGVHLNGNVENIFIKDISGCVGDDLVAVNAYDWDNSGINFGRARAILIDGVHSGADNPYKAIRLLPGVYVYRDGSFSDCRIDDLVMRNVSGIVSFKLYLQTAAYTGDRPDHMAYVGSCGHMYFEKLSIDLFRNVDDIYESVRHSPGYNRFGAFDICANVQYLEFTDIDLTLHEEYPETSLVCVGPKSITLKNSGGEWAEVFDPYASCTVEKIVFRNIRVNGEQVRDKKQLLQCVKLRPNPSFPATLPRGGSGEGKVNEVVFQE